MLNTQNIHLLRSIVMDEGASASRRLSSIDILASEFNAWHTKKCHTDYNGETPTRMTHFLRKALRRLLKSEHFKAPSHNSAIRARLLFMSGVQITPSLYRNTPEGPQKTQPVQELSEVERLLQQYREQAKSTS